MSMIKITQILLFSASIMMALACGGGGSTNADSQADNPGATNYSFRFKGEAGQKINVYGLDGSFNEPAPFISSADYNSEGYALLALEAGQAYRLRLEMDGVEIMEFIILPSDFERIENGILFMGEMNAATTFISSRVFAALDSSDESSQKARMKAEDVMTLLESYMADANMTSVSDATLTNIANYVNPTELRWIQICALSLRRVYNTIQAGEEINQGNLDAMVNQLSSLAKVESDGGDVSTLLVDYLALMSDYEPLSLSDAQALLGDNAGDALPLLVQLVSAASLSDALEVLSQAQGAEPKPYALLSMKTGEVEYLSEISSSANIYTDSMVFRRIASSDSLPLYADGEYVNVSSNTHFYMGIFEVTQGQYENMTSSTNLSAYEGDNKPVESVSWNEASAFSKALSELSGKSISLPTEAQWEYACRGSSVTTSDNTTDDYQSWRCFENGGAQTGPDSVGSYDANAYGLYDMHGNVAEWCLDYLETAVDGSLNPIGESSDTKAIRGGGWFNKAIHCTTINKTTASPSISNSVTGFRVIIQGD
ncbi:MAG: SUMF1/EgtB/PvdO family nonheme iron enzyme [Planctomycetes bacterium]|nr:SUMF1/EgtB/PvdO family nonheme iron enzyme [Planctomycetota bacterium]